MGKGNTIQGPTGIRVRLEQSSNLVDWECWTTFLLKAGPIEFYQTELPDELPNMIGQIPLESMDWVIDLVGRKLMGNPEHGGELLHEEF